MEKMLSLLSKAVHRAMNTQDLWEEINRVVCSVAMECLGEFFEKLDQELVKEHAERKGWRCENKESRTIMTLYGPVSFTRHFMYDNKGKGQYPLDKVLGIVPYMRASPDIWGKVVRIATSPGMTYRLTSEVINVITGASISHTTVKNFVDKAGASQEAMDQQQRRKLFEEGEVPEESPSVDQLFVEYDGLYVKGIDGSIEIKNKVSYTGWGENGKRRNLENRRVFSSVETAEDFMEGSYVDICNHHNIEASEIIVNGDGAQWIGKHLESLFVGNKVIRQLDPFHVKRAIRRGLRKQSELMMELEKAIKVRNRKKAEVVIETSLGNTDCPRDEKRIQDMSKYLMNHWNELIDWREEASYVPVNAGGMGTIESNQRRLAFRMKRRGMKWSKKGAQAVAKVQQSIANNEFHQILSWNLSIETPVTNRVKRMARKIGHGIKRTTYSGKIPTKINVAGAPRSSAIGLLSRIGSARSLIV